MPPLGHYRKGTHHLPPEKTKKEELVEGGIYVDAERVTVDSVGYDHQRSESSSNTVSLQVQNHVRHPVSSTAGGTNSSEG